ncbi:valine--tRNA ligase [Candidatus Saccharibacteria bacterium]|nr:valine--tRNA ligase [Candidatus Saccharibacteria bacterium]
MNLPKTYEPKQYEPTVYGLWESTNAFAATGKGTPYCIVMPPPNANGSLHIGHALDMNLKDISIRYRRMRGDDALFIPGSDHAGFETWVVYEKYLQEQGKSRFDFSREELYDQVWDFVEARRGDMELQLRALGISCSWADGVFTLDEKVIDTVYATFKKMWDDKLIYRGERIVNYCTTHQTSFADIEVTHKEEKSKLWHIAYPLLDHVGEIIVATTRPETMLGDTAVAVHPDDERYKKFIGSRVMIPIIEREIPVIADDAIDPTFGTGAVKVTPAHDPTDFEIGERHQLPRIKVIGADGKLTPDMPADLRGLDVLGARKKLLIQLESHEAIRKTEDYTHQVGHCYKCGTIIQPLLMDQWFVRIKPLADAAIEAIADHKIAFHPASKARELTTYLGQLRDWNISRQPAWGIPIPAFQNMKDPEDWIFDTRVDQETITVDGKKYKREEDTFDTWFSSGQWPYTVTDVLSGGELKRFYPSDLMETGSDLLRQWVARMIMFGLYRTETIPFKNVYMHGMVLDEKGQKMSKSKGNVINPMDTLGEYGSDALRMGIVAKRSPGQNQAFSTASVVAGRNFCNKLWNMARYIEGTSSDLSDRTPHPVTTADHWVIRQLSTAATEVGKLLDDFRYADAVDYVYHCIWDDVADWYLEASKDSAGQGMLAWVLETCLKLTHPFAPFVTETIWTTLKFEETLLIRSSWPEAVVFDDIAASEFDRLRELVIETRYVASELVGKQIMLYEHDTLIEDNRSLIARLARLEDVRHVIQPKGLRLAVPNREAWIDITEDELYEHQTKLELRLVKCREDVDRLQSRLANENYVVSAPAHLVEETRAQLADQLALEKKLIKELEVLSETS